MNYQWFVSPQTQYHQFSEPFGLELGGWLEDVEVAYRTWGQLNPQADNAILICHALTGSADADDWWAELFGPGKAFDPEVDFILCSNVLGSCYGTTGPISRNPQTGRSYGATFPKITLRDMVRLQARLLDILAVKRLKLVIGGSLGGMQVLEWAALYPNRVGAIVPIAVSGKHSAWCIGFSEAQRQAIYADPLWQGGHYSPEHPPVSGLAVARIMAMSTYRSWASFEEKFSRQRQLEPSEVSDQSFAIVSYLHHQGQKLVERFDANTYVTLTWAMDTYDLGRDRAGYQAVLGQMHQPAMVVSIHSDMLYPPVEQQELADLMPNCQLALLQSSDGHDAFLIDVEALNDLVVEFCHQVKTQAIASTPSLLPS